jgi:hypothetical protein
LNASERVDTGRVDRPDRARNKPDRVRRHHRRRCDAVGRRASRSTAMV